MAKHGASKQAKSVHARGRGGSKREAVPGLREEALPAGDVATGAAGPSSNAELLQRLRRKQEVFSKLGGLVSTLQRQENIGQWRSKLEELDSLKAECEQLRAQSKEKDAQIERYHALVTSLAGRRSHSRLRIRRMESDEEESDDAYD